MNCASASVSDGSIAAGKVPGPASVSNTLKQLLARMGVQETRASVAISDAAATFRVLQMPADATEQQVDAAVARELPLNADRIASRWIDVALKDSARVVYAVAWDSSQLKAAVDSVKLAGIDVSVVELKSASLARAVSLSSCVLVDLTSNPVELVLIDRHVPRLWHRFDLKAAHNEEVGRALAPPVRSILGFHRRSGNLESGGSFPVLISSEQELPASALAELGGLVNQPVELLAAPQRVPSNVRYSTYLACLGLIMRRS